MKQLRQLMTASVLVLLALAACKQSDKPVMNLNFETDDCGVVRRINPDEKTVYLVFTAHYSQNDSGRFENFDGIVPVLDTLKEKGVKGSFFPTGVCFLQEKYKEPLRRIIDEGHYLSAHSMNHLMLCDEADPTRTLVGADSIAADFAQMEEQLNALGLTKEQYYWMIPPYENYNAETAESMRKLGYHLLNPTSGFLTGMDWTSPGASNYVSGKEIMDNIWEFEKKNTMNGVILLIHAMNYPDRTDEDRVYTHLGEIIDTLRAKGYDFKTLFDVIAAEKSAQ